LLALKTVRKGRREAEAASRLQLFNSQLIGRMVTNPLPAVRHRTSISTAIHLKLNHWLRERQQVSSTHQAGKSGYYFWQPLVKYLPDTGVLTGHARYDEWYFNATSTEGRRV
jgi:hypothetical protein